MDLDIENDVAFVTGGGQGVGRAICKRLALEGAAVVVNDLFQERCQSVADEINASGGRAIGVSGDITDHAAVEKMMIKAREAFGPVSILVNNAGMLAGESGASFMHMDDFDQSTPDQWTGIIGLNLIGSMNCCHTVIPAMKELRRGRIINIISEAARVGEPKLAVYSAAKGGVLSLTKALAKELGRYTITVNAISLGNIDRDETTIDQLEEPRQKAARSYALARGLNRMGYARDVADAVAFLASPRAEYTTGVALSVSGGYSIG